MNERGEEIKLSRTEVSQAKIYTGAKAVENGYTDEIGDLETAVEAAADKAGLENYETTYRDPASLSGLLSLLSGDESAEAAGTPFDTPGVDRVRYLALWGEPSTIGNSTKVITYEG